MILTRLLEIPITPAQAKMSQNSPPNPSPRVLGIDIGGSGIKGALVDTRTGTLATERFRLPTPRPCRPEAVAEILAQIAGHFDYYGSAGITFPGIATNGVIYSATNVDSSWLRTGAAKLFQSYVGGSATVMNDADAAGYAEMRFGAGRERSGVVIMLTFGTGIDSAIFYNGVLLPNTELGALQLCGKDAELRASEQVRNQKDMSFKKWAGIVSKFLASLEKLFSPELFIIGGGISKKADKFLPHLQDKSDVHIEAARMQNNAGIIGAACLAKIRA